MRERVIDLDELNESFVKPVLVIGGTRHVGHTISLAEAEPFMDPLDRVGTGQIKGAELLQLARDMTTAFGFEPDVVEHVATLPLRGIVTVLVGFSRVLHGGMPEEPASPPAAAEGSDLAPSS